jgi:hypothetical protein
MTIGPVCAICTSRDGAGSRAQDPWAALSLLKHSRRHATQNGRLSVAIASVCQQEAGVDPESGRPWTPMRTRSGSLCVTMGTSTACGPPAARRGSTICRSISERGGRSLCGSRVVGAGMPPDRQPAEGDWPSRERSAACRRWRSTCSSSSPGCPTADMSIGRAGGCLPRRPSRR